MYLKRVHIENSGPLRSFSYEFPLSKNETPKPLILVGGNGSGKTNLLSIVADSLFEAAATHFTDVLPSDASGRSWFRVVGAATISAGALGSCSILQLEHDKTSILFKEKAGKFPSIDVANRISDALKPAASWPDEGTVKEIKIQSELSKKIFDSGVYLYCPASRAELPHWMNRNGVALPEFDLTTRYSNELKKPIFVDRGLDNLKQWMLSLLLGTRVDFEFLPQPQNGAQIAIASNIPNALAHKSLWNAMNVILQAILDDPGARFVWFGRAGANSLGFHLGRSNQDLPLNSLSAGQATLLNVFGTLVRYGDGTVEGALPLPNALSGICVIDEIDAHMHVDLQYRAIPKLLSMFPKMQFILSCHSPLFILGMEKTIGNDNISVLEMPSGTPIQAEAYSEFEHALNVLRDTKSFTQAVVDSVGDLQTKKLLVVLEGETDPIYLKAAAEILGHQELLKSIDLEWIGAKDPNTRQGFNTGKTSLNAMASLLRAKPDLVQRPVALFYDNDANKMAEDLGKLHIRSMPSNQLNGIVMDGIENILPEHVFTDNMFDRRESRKRDGGKTETTTLNKMKLCTHLCETTRNKDDFAGFIQPLNTIQELVQLYFED